MQFFGYGSVHYVKRNEYEFELRHFTCRPGDCRKVGRVYRQGSFSLFARKVGNPLEALKDYYETKWKFIYRHLIRLEEGEINGMDFCRLLSSSTRVIFITDTDRYAAECFRLDALDYLMDGLNFSTFFQSVSKAARWFSLQDAGTSDSKHRQGPEEVPKVIYMRCDNRIMRLDLERINYIEGMGDYVKIFCKDSPKLS